MEGNDTHSNTGANPWFLSIPIEVLSLKAESPHMDYFFRLEGSDRFNLQVWKSLAQNDLTHHLAFSGNMLGTLKGSTLHLRQDLAVRNRRDGSYFGGLTVVCILCHTLLARPGSKKLGGKGFKDLGWSKIQQLAPLLEGKHPAPSTLIVSKVQPVIASGYNAVSVRSGPAQSGYLSSIK